MNYEYDASNERCPLPLVNLRMMLKKMQSGDTCVILLADSGSKSDIPKLLDKQGYQYSTLRIDDSHIQLTIQA